jgi:hypothetical protein
MTLTKDAPLYRCHLPKVIDSSFTLAIEMRVAAFNEVLEEITAAT